MKKTSLPLLAGLLMGFFAAGGCTGASSPDVSRQLDADAGGVEADTMSPDIRRVADLTQAETELEQTDERSPDLVQADICQPLCEDDLGPYECGDDGCGGLCAKCPSGAQYSCLEHRCICTPQCENRDCGPDMCGGGCGQCSDNCCCHQGHCSCVCDLPDQWGPAVVFTNLTIGQGGLSGQALDVDENPETCAPAGTCERGLDNSLGDALASLQSEWDAQAILERVLLGSGVILLEFPDFIPRQQPMKVTLYLGSASQPDCAPETGCSYLVSPISYDWLTCLPAASITNATLSDDSLTAGGPGTHFAVTKALAEGLVISVELRGFQLQADVTQDETGVISLNGVLAAAIPKQDLLDLAEALAELWNMPTGDTLRTELEQVLVVDMDLDGDGQLTDQDGVSVGMPFTAIRATITGLEE